MSVTGLVQYKWITCVTVSVPLKNPSCSIAMSSRAPYRMANEKFTSIHSTWIRGGIKSYVYLYISKNSSIFKLFHQLNSNDWQFPLNLNPEISDIDIAVSY